MANPSPSSRGDAALIGVCCCLLQFVCVESIVTAVVDMYPKVFRRGYRRELLILGLSVVSYFLGLIMLTEVRAALCRGKELGLCLQSQEIKESLPQTNLPVRNVTTK